MVSFSQQAAVRKETPFLVQLEQIFVPSYCVTALDTQKIIKHALYVKFCPHNSTIVIVQKLLVHGHCIAFRPEALDVHDIDLSRSP